jgi:hypothetical protein
VRAAALGLGWTWEPIKDDPIALDEPEDGA